jgi:hypothetical protein
MFYRRILRTLIMLAFALPILLSGCDGILSSTLSGKVIDQDGNPLTDVTLHLTRAMATKYEADAYGGEHTVRLKDGKFKIKCKDCSAAHLFFSKEGYYSESLDLAFFEKKRGLVVVLNRTEHPAKLQELQGRAEVGPGISELVVVLDVHQSRTQTLERILEKSPSPPYLRLHPPRFEDGSLAITKAEFYDAVAGSALLDFSTADGGVVPYQPSTEYVQRAYREMTLAPEFDYQPSLELIPGSKDQYFYCKIGNRYGKGRAHGPRVDHRSGGRKIIAASVEIYLNPDGTQNLDDPSKF